jgi:hypothetical protein
MFMQLIGHYVVTKCLLIKYYQFNIPIKCEFVNLKLDPNVTYNILKIFILEVHQGIQAYTPIMFLNYMNKCGIDNN